METDQELDQVSSSTSFSLAPPTFKTILGNKLGHLHEVTTLSDDQKIDETNLPSMNPYHTFTKKPSSTLRSIKTLIKSPAHIVKEYI